MSTAIVPPLAGKPSRAVSVERALATMALREQVGRNLRLAREAAGQTATDWIKKYSLYHSLLSNWEAGRVYPDMLFLIKVCEDYGLTLDWFYRGERTGVVFLRVAAPKSRKSAEK